MRLIDADELELRQFTAAGSMSEFGRGWNEALADVRVNAPTIEAVEVVRCKDCAYYNTSGFGDGCGWCEYLERAEWDKHFCSYADRKEAMQ